MAMMRMTHPDIPDAEPALTTDEAFRAMWEPRGWVRADDAVVTAGEVLGAPVANLDGLTKAQLLEVAANLGISDVSSGSTKADIISAIQAQTTTQEA